MKSQERDELLVRIDQKVETLGIELGKAREHIGDIYTTISNDVKPKLERHSITLYWFRAALGAITAALSGLASWLVFK